MVSAALEAYRSYFQKIKQSNENHFLKDYRLVVLMEMIEKEFNIPAMMDKKFEEKNVDVMQLYREISNARKF